MASTTLTTTTVTAPPTNRDSSRTVIDGLNRNSLQALTNSANRFPQISSQAWGGMSQVNGLVLLGVSA